MLATKLELVDDSVMEYENVLEEIKTAISKEEIKLPAMPDIAIKIRDGFKDEQYDVMHIARMVQAEAGLAAYILKVANSPLHRGPMPIKTAKHAICRLGQHSVQSIVLTYTLRSLFETSSSQMTTLLKEQWQQSTSIAAISAILAERCEDFDPDQALLAGLLQDIGALPLLDWLNKNHNQGDDVASQFAVLCERFAPEVGEMILRAWQFDQDLINTVKACGDWTRDSGSKVDTADIVTIARHHYFMGKGELGKCPAITEIPAYHKLPFQELTPDQSLSILDEAKEEIAEIKGMLG